MRIPSEIQWTSLLIFDKLDFQSMMFVVGKWVGENDSLEILMTPSDRHVRTDEICFDMEPFWYTLFEDLNSRMKHPHKEHSKPSDQHRDVQNAR